jgi:hypothetical protein
MPTANMLQPIDVRPHLSAEAFYADYVNRDPVLIKGALKHMAATSRWSLPYFESLAPDLPVRLKAGRVSEGVTKTMRLTDYSRTVAEWEERVASGDPEGEPPAYLHDVPLIALIPRLKEDLENFPATMLPPFFREKWWAFPQFFVGPSRSETPLHFDTLLTHNLFFQFKGSKRFVTVDAADCGRCYTHGWRWSPVDPENPDLERFPRFAGVRLRSCLVEAGDLFYMPPGMLHKVVSLTDSVSFNIDWHDRHSALAGLAAVRHGMPMANLRYNALFALGVCGRVPLGALMPALKSYFEYVS